MTLNAAQKNCSNWFRSNSVIDNSTNQIFVLGRDPIFVKIWKDLRLTKHQYNQEKNNNKKKIRRVKLNWEIAFTKNCQRIGPTKPHYTHTFANTFESKQLIPFNCCKLFISCCTSTNNFHFLFGKKFICAL